MTYAVFLRPAGLRDLQNLPLRACEDVTQTAPPSLAGSYPPVESFKCQTGIQAKIV